ncbi:site-specific recombinase XerD [Sphingomonas faeni]|uniref:Site-specific recombinase XerD n=1 Tax=Sphingomonas faeni TaxID=185950 RepID=A0A2T5U839_9SPHN|nr:site-specific integrase [Sphingomonas faeni]PTW47628.1 site-specific recombinase XerD [Sphingomonas faeni]
MVSKVRNATEAKAWEATDKRQEIAVDGTKNLYLVIQPNPSAKKSWAWRARRIGEPGTVKVTLGSLDTHSFKQAVDWSVDLTRARDLGEDTKAAKAEREAQAEAAKQALEATQAKTADWFWRELYHPRFVSVLEDKRETERMWKTAIKPAIGHLPLADIDHDHLANMIEKVRTTAPVTANRLTTMVKTMFKRSVSSLRTQTGLKVDPAQHLVKPTNEDRTRKQRVLDRRELGYLLAALDGLNGKGYRAVYARALKLCAMTGVRISEALEASWSEFDLEAGLWSIPDTRTKNDLPHLVPLVGETLDWLKSLKAKATGDWVFSTNGKTPLTGTSKPQAAMLSRTSALAERDGLEHEVWSAHAIRRTFSTQMSAITDDDLTPSIPPMVVEALLNHVSGMKAGVAGVYNKHAYLKERRSALVLWNAHLKTVLAEERARASAAMKVAA